MSLAMRIASGSLALSLLVIVALAAASQIGAEIGWSWSRDDGSWAAALGFGAMWLAPLSGTALLALIAAWVVRDLFRRNGQHAPPIRGDRAGAASSQASASRRSEAPPRRYQARGPVAPPEP